MEIDCLRQPEDGAFDCVIYHVPFFRKPKWHWGLIFLFGEKGGGGGGSCLVLTDIVDIVSAVMYFCCLT